MENVKEQKKTIKYNQLVIIATILLVPLNLAFSGLVKGDFLICILGVVGCAALPLWAVLIDEGNIYYQGTVKYMLYLLIVAIISAYPYFLCFGSKHFSPQVFFSLAFTGFVYFGTTLLVDKFKDTGVKILTIGTVSVFLILIIRSDWSLAIIPALIIHLYKDKFFKLAYYVVSFSVVFFAVGLYMYISKGSAGNSLEYLHMISLVGCTLSLPLVKNFDRSPQNKPIKLVQSLIYILILITIFLLKNFLD